MVSVTVTETMRPLFLHGFGTSLRFNARLLEAD